MNQYNYHTHTNFCDGSATPEAYVQEAIKLGFQALGFSGHAPVPMPNEFAIKIENLEAYANTIRELQQKYTGQIDIFLALEFDFIPGVLDDFSIFSDQLKLDYTIGSIHLVKNGGGDHLWFIDGGKQNVYDEGLKNTFGGDIQKAVKAYYHQVNTMIESQVPDIIGHLDKIKMHNQNRYFQTDEVWYQTLFNETLELIKEKECIVEVNTRGLYKKRSDELFPGTNILKKIKALDIPVIVSSDAHKPEELSLGISETLVLLKEIGFKELMKFDGDDWVEYSLG